MLEVFLMSLRCILVLRLLVFQAMINCWGVKLMAKINTVITVVKLLSIIFIVIIGISGVIQRGI